MDKSNRRQSKFIDDVQMILDAGLQNNSFERKATAIYDAVVKGHKLEA